MADGRVEDYSVSGTKASLGDSYFHEGAANGNRVAPEDSAPGTKPSQLSEVADLD